LSPTEAGLKLPMSLMPIRAPQPSRAREAGQTAQKQGAQKGKAPAPLSPPGCPHTAEGPPWLEDWRSIAAARRPGSAAS
jgi:hypothetical protein